MYEGIIKSQDVEGETAHRLRSLELPSPPLVGALRPGGVRDADGVPQVLERGPQEDPGPDGDNLGTWDPGVLGHVSWELG